MYVCVCCMDSVFVEPKDSGLTQYAYALGFGFRYFFGRSLEKHCVTIVTILMP